MFGGETIDQRMQRSGPTSGFDYLRLALSLSVIAWHSYHLTHGEEAAAAASMGPARPLMALVLPMFFALSGFLVAGSLERSNSLTTFLGLRAIRIFPALTVEIFLSALLLGPIVTDLSASQYYSGHEFRSYFLNILGWIHFTLPGVYTHNLVPSIVNYSLWTIPYELECYIVLSFLFVVGFTGRLRAYFIPSILALSILLTAWSVFHHSVKVSGPVPGRALVIAFLCGVALYLFRSRVVLSIGTAALALVSAIALIYVPVLSYFAVIPAAYLTVFLGLLTPRRIGLIEKGDFSYGLYLFAFPIQQLHQLIMSNQGTAIGNFTFSSVLCLIYAAFSWNFVEHPILKRKNAIIAFVRSALSAKTQSADMAKQVADQR